MVAILTPAERADFKRCRRAWDFGARSRRNLEPVDAPNPLNADRLIRDALAVYYFPGMWDWSRGVVLPLVSQALDKGLERLRPAPVDDEVAAIRRLLGAYLEWAPGVERWAPVLVEVDYQVDLPDPDDPGTGLRVRTGASVQYRGRLDLLAVDEHDAYWIVRHLVVPRWTPLEALFRDEDTVAACWAWEQYYLGMRIAGTVHNELRVPADFEPDTDPARAPADRGGLPQSGGSGGGRSIPQHRRLYAQSSEPDEPDRVSHDLGPWFRRTWIRRSRAEIDQAGRQLAGEARQILDPDVSVYPSPSETRCDQCAFASPCRAVYEGEGVDSILAAQYRPRLPQELIEGRLGGLTWSTGRGAAPPRFGGAASGAASP